MRRSDITVKTRRLLSACVGGVAVLVMSFLVVPSAPAAAAVTSEPVAIAVGRTGDKRVMQVSGDGKSNNSKIVMAPYVANTSATVGPQRWTFDRVSGTGIPAFAYRIKNPATGKCLNASGATAQNKAPVILYTCIGTAATKNEIWWMDSNPPPGGARFRSLRDNRCLDVTGANTANNAATEVYTCVETDSTWNQMFKTRTGSFDCTVRDSDWQVTAGLCVSTVPSAGIVSNWFNTPAAIAYRNPSTYVLSNEVRSRVDAAVVNAQGVEQGNVQLGWRAVGPASSTGSVTYNAYWQEYGNLTEEYHAIPSVDASGVPNGSAAADGVQHTYLMLGSATPNQWDLFYDFNWVATTVRQSGGRSDFADIGVQSRYIDALTKPTPFEFRTQLLNTAGVWAKPDVTSSALGNAKECGTFPVWEDFSNGAGNNQPPWCLSTARTLATGTSAVDKLVISKPTSPVSVAPAHPTLAATGAQRVVNGVDQATLNACMATATSACLSTVPGLQRCVERHLLCHASAAPARANKAGTRRPSALTSAAAVKAARTQIPAGPAGATSRRTQPAHVARTTLAETRIAGLEAGGHRRGTAVYLITADERVHSWKPGSDATYGRWTAVVAADTGELLYARLDRGE